MEDLPALAPSIHKLDFETADVRVLEVTLPPHTAEPTHRIDVPFIVYIDQPAKLTVTGDTKHVTRINDRMRRIEASDFQTIRNDSGETYHAFQVYLKRAESNLASSNAGH